METKEIFVSPEGRDVWPGDADRPLRTLEGAREAVEDFGSMRSRGMNLPIAPAGLELFFDGVPMILARWPNRGWARIEEVVGEGRFRYEGDRPERWVGAEEVWLHGYWRWDWADSYVRVGSVDPKRREIETCEPHGVYGYRKGARYYALNILEELDEPGEWYLDREKGVLYFWPPGPVEGAEVVVSVLEEPLVRLEGTSEVAFRGISFEFARGNGVEVEEGEGNVVEGCTFRCVGGVAVWIRGGMRNGVSGCEICYAGEGGIILEGGDRRTLKPAGNFAVGNHIWEYSRTVRTYRPAVHIFGVGNRVAHNMIHSAPHVGILLHGNEHIVEFNVVYHICTETQDVGAFYMGRDWTERGNIVRYNYFHDLGEGDVSAVYLDDWASGTWVYGNRFYRAGRGVLIGEGRDNTVEGNIFVECRPAVHIDARGLNWARYYFDGTDDTLFERLRAVDHGNPPYSERYPDLARILEDEPAVPKGNRIVRNICVGGRWLDVREDVDMSWVEVEDNIVVPYPGGG